MIDISLRQTRRRSSLEAHRFLLGHYLLLKTNIVVYKYPRIFLTEWRLKRNLYCDIFLFARAIFHQFTRDAGPTEITLS